MGPPLAVVKHANDSRAPPPTPRKDVRGGEGEKTREGCIRIARADEFSIMSPRNISGMQDIASTVVAPEAGMLAEITAYASAARRGDVLPACMRLTTARAEADWELRDQLVRLVGPECAPDALDRACSFMPDAPEPRLLRAGRSMAIAASTSCDSMSRAWLAYAQADLLEAARLDTMDPTARGLLAEIVGATAWAAPCCAA